MRTIVTAAVATAAAVIVAAPAAAATRVDVPRTAGAVIAAITRQGDVPVRVPGRIPVDATGRLVAAGGPVGAHGYVIRIESPGCGGAPACTVATLRGAARESVRGPQTVALAGGLTGRFTPMRCGATCAPPSIAWRQDGVTYRLQVTVPRSLRATMVALANDAITAGPRGVPTPPAHAHMVACSASGDTCMGIYVRGGRVVLRRTYLARYVGRDRLCLRYPARTAAMRGAVVCRTVSLRSEGRAWAAQAVFALRGPGVYRAVGYPSVRVTVGG